MDQDFLLFIVDDDITARLVLNSIFSKEYAVELFDSAEACLERLKTVTPALFLLDVGLPGLSGYELCREIRERTATAETPVIFVSGNDDLDSRLCGYDSGGDDFVVKPYSAAYISRRVALMKESIERQKRLQSQAAESEELVSLVLSNNDEYALLIQCLRQLNICEGWRPVAEALLALLRKFSLNGTVQIRLANQEHTLGDHGEDNALEVSIMQHVRSMDRIFEFQQRAVFNFAAVTLLINNMPRHDPELCGRLRDHLAIAAECADARLQALAMRQGREAALAVIAEEVGKIQQTVDQFSQRYDHARYEGALITREILDELSASFSHIGISLAQEEALEQMVQNKTTALVDAYDFGEATRQTLLALRERLNTLLAEQ